MRHKLIVVMLDGFRWDYIQRDESQLPAFRKLKTEGVYFEYLEPILPVLSYPNWTTMVTGVYAEQHGITGNHMWDKTQARPSRCSFQLMSEATTKYAHWWQDTPEPIWIGATKAGIRTFTRFWSRSDLPCHGVSVEESSCFVEANTAQDLADTLDIGFEKLQKGFDLVMLYSAHADYTGHVFGPESEAMKEAVRNIDQILGRLLEKLDAAKPTLNAPVNLIVLSDHGMTSTGESSGTTYLNLSDFITESDVQAVVDFGPYVGVKPAEGNDNTVLDKLRSMEGVDVYKKDEIPDEFHIKGGRFMLDIVLIARPGFFIRGLLSTEKQFPQQDPTRVVHYEGFHGYFAKLEDQRGILLARGPAFRQGVQLPPIRMVDVYQIFVNVLGIKGHQHEGDWSRVEAMFAHQDGASRSADVQPNG